MGAEQLEDSEFEPMFEAVKPTLAGKKSRAVRLLRLGRRRMDAHLGGATARQPVITLCAESVICQDEPDDAALAACAALGEALK